MSANIKRADSPKVREAIFALEDYMKTQPQVELEVVHHFAPGVYTRELFMPAGIFATGYIHKTEHISIMLCGKMLVPDDNGGSKEICGPMVEVAQPGVKRVGYVTEDVRWLTVHPTDETDIEVLEEMLVTNDFSEVEHLVDQQDYALLGVSQKLIESLQTIEVHKGDIDGLEIRESKRHGLGLFVKDFICSGAIIAPALLDGRLMEYSRYTNHSMSPNAQGVIIDANNINIVAIRDIESEEVTMDYRVNLGVMK